MLSFPEIIAIFFLYGAGSLGGRLINEHLLSSQYRWLPMLAGIILVAILFPLFRRFFGRSGKKRKD